MNKKERCFTLIIAPNNPSKVRQFQLSIKRLYFMLFALIVLMLLASYGAFRYLYAMKHMASYDAILTNLNEIKEENLEYREKTGQLADKFSHIEMMAKNVSRLTGIDFDNPESSSGGIGGFSPDNYLNSSLSQKNIDFLRQLNEKTNSLEKKITHLKNQSLEQNLFISSLPAAWPVRGYIGSAFGARPDPMSGSSEFHTGVDICAPLGAKVAAPADGMVMFAGAQHGYGYIVILAHKYGLTTRYAHLSSYAVRPGQLVKKGDVLGFVGSTGRSTGPHLHYEVHLDERPVNPVRFLGGMSDL